MGGHGYPRDVGDFAAAYPVVQKLKNVWITDAEADRITIFCDGEKETFFLEAETEGSDSVPAPEQMREQLADVELTDELVSAVALKTDKFTGRVLSANENGIEIEGRGRIPLARITKDIVCIGSLPCARSRI